VVSHPSERRRGDTIASVGEEQGVFVEEGLGAFEGHRSVIALVPSREILDGL
jgi:hypothetical protein